MNLNYLLLHRLVGDVLISTAFLSYAGPFNQEYRTKMLSAWRSLLEHRDIPLTDDLNITNWLVDNATVSSFIIKICLRYEILFLIISYQYRLL